MVVGFDDQSLYDRILQKKHTTRESNPFDRPCEPAFSICTGSKAERNDQSLAAFTPLTRRVTRPMRAFYPRGRGSFVSKARFNGLWVEGFSPLSANSKHAEAR